MKAVFLSASIPDPLRHPNFYETADFISIREAVMALVLTVTPHAPLVFGGHPAISPLVYLTAQKIDTLHNIVIYQSEFFADRIPKESLAFEKLVWVPGFDNIDMSLELMRLEMLFSFQFEASFFIGGMEGILDEFDLFSQIHPRVAKYPVATTGAAAKILIQSRPHELSPTTLGYLSEEYAYQWLFKKLLKSDS